MIVNNCWYIVVFVKNTKLINSFILYAYQNIVIVYDWGLQKCEKNIDITFIYLLWDMRAICSYPLYTILGQVGVTTICHEEINKNDGNWKE